MYEISDIVTADCPVTFYLVDAGYTYGATLGKVGLLNSFASVDFDLAWRYFYAGQAGELKTLNLLGNYYIELSKAFGCVSGEKIDSAFDKSIERVADAGFSNTLYPPYLGITEEEFCQVDASMKRTIQKYRALSGLS